MKVKDLIFRVGFESKDQTADQLQQKITAVTKAYAGAKAGTMEFVEAEKKAAAAAAAAGAEFDRTGKKATQMQQSLKGAGESGKALTNLQKIALSISASLDKGEMGVDQFADAIVDLKNEIDQLDSIEEKTKALREFGDALPGDLGKGFLEEMEKGLTVVDEKTVSAKTKLKQMKAELLTLDEGSDEFNKLAAEAGALEDQIGDVNARVKALASDTAGIDGLVGIAEGAVGAFTAFEGVLALTGAEGEDYQKTLAKVQGAMALLQGTQQVMKTLMEEGAARTTLAAAAQRVYAVAVGQATGAQKAFRLALLATGVGAIIVGLGLLAANWTKVSQAIGFSNPAREQSNAINKAAAESIAEETAAIKLAQAEIKNANTTQQRRVELINELKAKYPNYLKDINAETASYEELDKALNNVTKSLFLKAKADATQDLLTEKIKEQIALQNKYKEIVNKQESFGSFLFGSSAETVKEDFDKVTKEIDFFIQEIISDKKKIDSLGGDPTGGTVKAAQSTEKVAKARAGTIKALEEVVSALRKKAREDLQIGSDKFFDTIDQLQEAEDRLKKAEEAFNTEVNKPPAEGSIQALEERLSAVQKLINETSQTADNYTDIVRQLFEAEDILNQARKKIERPAALETPDLFTTADTDLQEAERHELAMAQIKKKGEARLLEIEIFYKVQRLNLLKKFGKLSVEEEKKINNELEELRLQLANLPNDGVEEADKKRLQAIIDGSAVVVQQALSAAQQIVAIESQKNDQLIQLQSQRVEEAKKIADKGNAEVLQEEEKRLNELNRKRERFVRTQQALAAVQLIAESSIAIVKAAQTGPAAPFTIAATLIALAAGLAQARALASQAAFYDGGTADWSKLGGYTGGNNPRGVSTSVGSKPYTYHQKEYIMDHSITGFRNNLKWFDHIRANRIDLEEIFSRRGGNVNVISNDNSELIDAVRSIPGVTVSMNHKGVITVVESHQNRQKKFAKRRSIK